MARASLSSKSLSCRTKTCLDTLSFFLPLLRFLFSQSKPRESIQRDPFRHLTTFASPFSTVELAIAIRNRFQNESRLNTVETLVNREKEEKGRITTTINERRCVLDLLLVFTEQASLLLSLVPTTFFHEGVTRKRNVWFSFFFFFFYGEKNSSRVRMMPRNAPSGPGVRTATEPRESGTRSGPHHSPPSCAPR